MIENQGIAFEEDPTINQVQQNQRNVPHANAVNQGVEVKPPRVNRQGLSQNPKGKTTKGSDGE